LRFVRLSPNNEFAKFEANVPKSSASLRIFWVLTAAAAVTGHDELAKAALPVWTSAAHHRLAR
jgi:hypothetical protein